MKINYKNGDLTFSMIDLIEGMTSEEKSDLAESLACEGAIIKHVSDQILDGWTESGFYGCSDSGKAEPTRPVDIARRVIANRSGEVAAKEIAALEKALADAEAKAEKEGVLAAKARRYLYAMETSAPWSSEAHENMRAAWQSEKGAQS